VTTIQAAALDEFVRHVLVKASVNRRGAAVIADALVDADLRGVHSHGVGLLPRYVHGFRSGQLNGAPRLRIVHRKGAAATLDGDNGLGHVVGTRAMAIAIKGARSWGIGICAVRNSNHFGAAAYFALQAADAGMIGFATTNAPPVMAPWGGQRKLLGNNPISFAIPRGGAEPPIVLDMACTVVARGKIRMKALAGERLPEGWATDADGNPTDDPRKALEGLLLPAGGPKGYGLAVVAEVLSAALSGATMAPEIADGPGEQYLAQGIGHLMIAIDIGAFSGRRDFLPRVDGLATTLATSDPAPGYSRVFLPGELEDRSRAQARIDGIDLPIGVVRRLEALGRELGVRWIADVVTT
jgi:LDH2 family malate/lactate/ureidoglycolate dehydrogenase